MILLFSVLWCKSTIALFFCCFSFLFPPFSTCHACPWLAAVLLCSCFLCFSFSLISFLCTLHRSFAWFKSVQFPWALPVVHYCSFKTLKTVVIDASSYNWSTSRSVWLINLWTEMQSGFPCLLHSIMGGLAHWFRRKTIILTVQQSDWMWASGQWKELFCWTVFFHVIPGIHWPFRTPWGPRAQLHKPLGLHLSVIHISIPIWNL